LLEEARVRFHRSAGFNNPSADPEGTVMVASVAIEYLGQSHFPDPLDFHVGFARVGSSSYDLAQLVTQGGAVVIFARSTLVSVCQGRSCPISDDRRALVEAWMLK
jgi:acyl-CoA thioester hydrolase